ncbi:hypothetical protein BCE_3238 [Bacillus cereus ATCC 10987]|uniref:Uncharacterized protein n=1 Tax=Bacillus cereus (strain ATCC 10987 / NRS 248) TaxID=222523 RepID=Q735B4_BACC1|nr:hypothetical protein BCE_3238 [Bacillus cereus ATCC 10987]
MPPASFVFSFSVHIFQWNPSSSLILFARSLLFKSTIIQKNFIRYILLI